MGTSITNTFTNGVATAAADVETNFTDVRTWLNGGVVAADIDSAVIAHTHVYKPDVYGYPRQGNYGAWGSQSYRRAGEIGIDVADQLDRVDMTFASLREDDVTPIPGLSQTLFIAAGSRIEISAWTSAVEFRTGADPYPANAGRLAIWWQRRGDIATGFTELASTRRYLLTDTTSTTTPAIQNDLSNRRINMLGSFLGHASTDDVYDVMVAYTRNSAAAAANRLIFGRRGIVIEVDLE